LPEPVGFRVWGLGLFLITMLSYRPNLADDTLQQDPGIAGPHIHNKSLDFCFYESGFGSSACTRGSAQGPPDVELYRPWAWRGHVVSCESKLFREICMIFNCIDLHLWKNWKSSLNWVCVIFNSRDRNSFFAFLQDVAESVSLVLDFALFCFLLCFFHFSSLIFLQWRSFLFCRCIQKLLQKCPLTFSQYESRDSQKFQPFFFLYGYIKPKCYIKNFKALESYAFWDFQ
jgi:hypothetical protein